MYFKPNSSYDITVEVVSNEVSCPTHNQCHSRQITITLNELSAFSKYDLKKGYGRVVCILSLLTRQRNLQRNILFSTCIRCDYYAHENYVGILITDTPPFFSPHSPIASRLLRYRRMIISDPTNQYRNRPLGGGIGIVKVKNQCNHELVT